MKRPLASTLKKVVLAGLAFVFTFALIEGLSSEVLLADKLLERSRQPLAERFHTKYDPELGWVALPNLYLPDMYGPGIYLRSNSLGFRNDDNFDRDPPVDRVRVICVGDSFTLGYGVDNSHPWCHRLEVLDNRLQTVNMGQGGYGIDQAYLWYRRDGGLLAHRVVIFAFVTLDFDRMQRSSFFGYGKPIFKIENGDLRLENVPTPRRAFYLPWLFRNLPSLRELRSVQLAQGILRRLSGEARETDESLPPSRAARSVAAAILGRLQALAAERGAVVALVYLPTEGDYDGDPVTDAWRQFIAEESARRGVHFIDLVSEFQKMPRDLRSLFIQPNGSKFREAAGHYTVKGNEVVARMLLPRLEVLPEISSRMNGHSPNRASAG